MTKKKWIQYPEGKDIVFGIVIMILMAAIFIRSCFFPSTNASGNVDSGFFPRMGSLVGFLMGALLTVQSIRKVRKLLRQAQENPAEEDCGDGKTDVRRIFRIVFSLVWLAAYLFFMNIVGMPLSSIIFLFVEMLVLTNKEKRTPKGLLCILIVSIVMPLVVYFPFRYIFDVMLPMGIFR